ADGDDETSVAAEGGDPTTVPAGPAGDPCRIEQLAAALREGMPTYDYEPSGSPQELAARTEMVVWGELIDATAGPPEVGGTRLVVRAREAVGSDGRPVDPPAAVWIDTE